MRVNGPPPWVWLAAFSDTLNTGKMVTVSAGGVAAAPLASRSAARTSSTFTSWRTCR